MKECKYCGSLTNDCNDIETETCDNYIEYAKEDITPNNKERTIKELLQVMLDNQQLFEGGLCRWAINLYENIIINYNELNKLNTYIITHPTLRGVIHAYYWEYGKIEPRIEWLKDHIQLQV